MQLASGGPKLEGYGRGVPVLLSPANVATYLSGDGENPAGVVRALGHASRWSGLHGLLPRIHKRPSYASPECLVTCGSRLVAELDCLSFPKWYGSLT